MKMHTQLTVYLSLLLKILLTSHFGFGSLPLTINVSQQGTFKTELTVKQPNMEGHSNSTFTFNAELRNRTAETQLYALQAAAPPGWNVVFKSSGYKQVTSVNVEPNK